MTLLDALPRASTLADRAAFAMADRVAHTARTAGRPVSVGDDLVVAWQGSRGTFTNLAVVLSAPTDWDAVLARVREVVPVGVPVTLLSPFSTPDLTRRGWDLIGHPPLMGRQPGGLLPPSVPSELRILEVIDQAGLEVFERTLIDGFPMPSLQPYEWGGMFHEHVLGGPTRLWVGEVDGRPVAVAGVHVAADVNCVEFVATQAADRARGYGAAVTWAATTADPTCPAVLVASDPGRPVYERLGYTALTRWTMWISDVA